MTIPPNLRWLELLLELIKASGWTTAAISGAAGLFLLIAQWGWIPKLDPWMIQLAVFVFLLCGLLAITSFLSALFRFFPLQVWILHWVKIHREKQTLRAYIPHLTEDERQILGYLIAKNQKIFTAAGDGGYAMTLISRGIIVRALQPGQMFSMEDTPFAIPDHIWKVLLAHKADLPYAPPNRHDGIEPYPWRVPWNVR